MGLDRYMEMTSWGDIWPLIVGTGSGITGIVAAIKFAAQAYRSHVRRVADDLERDRTAKLAEAAVKAKNDELAMANKESRTWQQKYEDCRVTVAELSAELRVLTRGSRPEGQ